jgi:hypothetical protein
MCCLAIRYKKSEFFSNLLEDLGCTGTLVKPDEWPFLYNNLVVPLNQKVFDTAQTYGWHFVGGTDIVPETGYHGPYFPVAPDFTFSGGSGHGYCTPAGVSWVVNAQESLSVEGTPAGTSHPNASGQMEYAKRIVQAINYYTPPQTVATATSGGQPYTFGSWTTKDVDMTLTASTKLATAGVGNTYYAVDDPNCSTTDPADCAIYRGTFTIDTSGRHTVTFFSANASGVFEKMQSVQVWVDNQPPVMTCTATPPMLWPPNHKMTPVQMNITAVSAAFGPTPFTLKSMTASQGDPATEIQGFVIGQPSTSGWLLASRLGTVAPGQIYMFVYQASDELGLTSTCAVYVMAPHDQGQSH